MKGKDKRVNDLLTTLPSFPAVLEWVKSLYIKEERWSSVDEVESLKSTSIPLSHI